MHQFGLQRIYRHSFHFRIDSLPSKKKKRKKDPYFAVLYAIETRTISGKLSVDIAYDDLSEVHRFKVVHINFNELGL